MPMNSPYHPSEPDIIDQYMSICISILANSARELSILCPNDLFTQWFTFAPSGVDISTSFPGSTFGNERFVWMNRYRDGSRDAACTPKQPDMSYTR